MVRGGDQGRSDRGRERTGGPGEAPRGGCPRWIGPVLLISLGLNLAVVGTLAGQWLRDDGKRERMGFTESVAEALPEERRALVREMLEGRRPDFATRAEAYREATDAVVRAFGAEPFDRAALEMALMKRMDLFGDRFRQRSEQLSALADRLTAEERRRIAQMIAERNEERLRRWQRREAKAE